ncbi:hypothetical protein VN97_g12446 [Penicillium thymicola]|uniref:Uncharacterized protein n=1 Tax=Penicillium thymicola TaxID=293382 RepID=A0AAI9X212_PENTH|nr:hypothetical protein VN97_g12446 [Penicillium thymicola]
MLKGPFGVRAENIQVTTAILDAVVCFCFVLFTLRGKKTLSVHPNALNTNILHLNILISGVICDEQSMDLDYY